MYIPVQFRERRPEVLTAAVRSNPLANLVTHSADGYQVSHIPMVLKADHKGRTVLDCHVARANPHWQAAVGAPATIAIFGGPQSYISPSWYPSKREHGRVVPTWNYIAVHATGTLRVMDADGWLQEHLLELTDAHERTRSDPWSVADAPPGFVDALSGSIVGMRLTVDTMVGGWKMQQHRSDADRQGLIQGLEECEAPGARQVAAVMTALERERQVS
jgi:transcriptional regulator